MTPRRTGRPGGRSVAIELERIAHEHGSAYVYDRASVESCCGRAARDGRYQPAVLRNEGKPECRPAAYASPRVGLAFECVSRGEVRAGVRGCARPRSRQDPVHAQFRAAFSEYEWAIGSAFSLTSTTSTLCATGASCSATGDPGPHRHGIRPGPPRSRAHCGRAFQVRRAVVRIDGVERLVEADGDASRRRCMRTPAAASSTSRNWNEVGEHARAACPSTFRTRVPSISAAASACPRSPGGPRSTSPRCRESSTTSVKARYRRSESLARAGPLPRGAGGRAGRRR